MIALTLLKYVIVGRKSHTFKRDQVIEYKSSVLMSSSIELETIEKTILPLQEPYKLPEL